MKRKKIFCIAALLLTAAAVPACSRKTNQTGTETAISRTIHEESGDTENHPSEAGQNSFAQPEDERAENSRPETSIPQTAQAGTAQPETNPSKNSPAETVLSDTDHPETGRPGQNRPVTQESGPQQPDTSRSGFEETVSGTENGGRGEAPLILAAPSVTGALHVEGTQLTGQNGEAVQLKGISTHGLAWFPEYVNEECFQELKETWQINVIRLAMYTAEYGGYCSGGDKEALKAKIREGVEYALAADLYVVVDWHILSDSNPQTYKEEAKAFFDEMASLYAGSDHVLYEICNEPNGSASWSEIKSYAEEVIGVIRAHDEDAVILIGTPNWSQSVDQAAADPITGYDNLMYTLHFYAATHKEDLRNKMTDALEAGLPVFVSEYGICDASGSGSIDEEQADQWIAQMNEYGVSYVAWNLSNKNETSAILSDACQKTSGFLQEDLSASGRWLFEMLTGSQPEETEKLPESTSQPPQTETQPPQTETQPPQAETQPPQEPAAVTLTGGDLELTPVLVNSWESDGQSFYHYTMTLRNVSGRAGSAWSVELEFSGEITLSDGWNGDYLVQGKTLFITSKDYNGAIAADGTVSDVGFIVSGGSL